MDIRYLSPLTPQEQVAHGVPAPQPFAFADRVRYSELDPLQHVNNKAYHDWFETARTEYFRQLCDPAYGDAPKPRTVLHSATIRYLDEILPRETYIVTARVAAFRSTSYTLDQQVWVAGTLRATLACVMVMLHTQMQPDGTRQKYPLPEALKQLFLTRDGAEIAG